MAAAGLLLAAGMASAQIQQAWVVRYDNGISNGQHEALKMALGSQGDIYVCGFSQDGNSNLDYVVLKYASNGVLRWASRFGSPTVSQARPTGFVVDAGDNAVVTGNAGTVKFADVGGEAWVEPYAGLSVAVDSNQNVFVTGVGTNFDTVKLNPAGGLLWRAEVADVGPTIGQVVRVDSLGNAYVAGSDAYLPVESGGKILWFDCRLLVAKFSPNGALLWNMTPTDDANSRATTVEGMELDDGDDVDVAFTESVAANQFFVYKFDGGGKVLWSEFNPDPDGPAIGTALASDAGENVFITGQFGFLGPGNSYATLSYGTYKFGANGPLLWSNVFPVGRFAPSSAQALALDVAGDCYVSGYSPVDATSNDIVTIAYDPNGKQLWLERYDGPRHGDDEGNAIAVDAQGNVYVAGYDTPVGGGTEMVLIKYATVTGKHEANGSFQLEAQGAANEPFDVRASTNLADWLDLGTYGADTNGVLLFTDTNAGLFPQRFYVAKPE